MPLDLVFFILLLLVTYATGSLAERLHFKNLRKREQWSRKMIVTNFRTLPPEWEVTASGLVTGSVVISVDYFKRILAGLRGLFGGRIHSYEPLLDRARREAIMRMKEEALSKGYNAVINLRLETSRLASSGKDGKGTAGVEMLAFGTGIKRARQD